MLFEGHDTRSRELFCSAWGFCRKKNNNRTTLQCRSHEVMFPATTLYYKSEIKFRQAFVARRKWKTHSLYNSNSTAHKGHVHAQNRRLPETSDGEGRSFLGKGNKTVVENSDTKSKSNCVCLYLQLHGRHGRRNMSLRPAWARYWDTASYKVTEKQGSSYL